MVCKSSSSCLVRPARCSEKSSPLFKTSLVASTFRSRTPIFGFQLLTLSLHRCHQHWTRVWKASRHSFSTWIKVGESFDFVFIFASDWNFWIWYCPWITRTRYDYVSRAWPPGDCVSRVTQIIPTCHEFSNHTILISRNLLNLRRLPNQTIHVTSMKTIPSLDDTSIKTIPSLHDTSNKNHTFSTPHEYENHTISAWHK